MTKTFREKGNARTKDPSLRVSTVGYLPSSKHLIRQMWTMPYDILAHGAAASEHSDLLKFRMRRLIVMQQILWSMLVYIEYKEAFT